MKTRIITGVIAAALLIAALAVSIRFPVTLNIAMALVSALAAFEIAGAAGIRRVYTVTVASVLIAAYLPFAPLMDSVAYPVTRTVVYAYLLFLAAHQIFHHRAAAIPELLVTALVSIFAPAALTCIVRTRDLGGTTHGLFLVVLLLLAAWCSDTGAYFVGVRFGRHKLCPEISPKKTIEGLAGGIVSCVLILEAAALVYSRWIVPGTMVSWVSVALLAACCSVISVIGDLSFSLIKRHYGIKDYGKIMPGHGGMLDRFDSVIFVAPFFLLIMQYLPIIHA